MALTLAALNAHVWRTADILRGQIGSSDYALHPRPPVPEAGFDVFDEEAV
jgi:hypothetical protein